MLYAALTGYWAGQHNLHGPAAGGSSANDAQT